VFFLLEMGLVAARHMGALGRFGLFLPGFANPDRQASGVGIVPPTQALLLSNRYPMTL
jgi:hypothetical protein